VEFELWVGLPLVALVGNQWWLVAATPNFLLNGSSAGLCCRQCKLVLHPFWCGLVHRDEKIRKKRCSLTQRTVLAGIESWWSFQFNVPHEASSQATGAQQLHAVIRCWRPLRGGARFSRLKTKRSVYSSMQRAPCTGFGECRKPCAALRRKNCSHNMRWWQEQQVALSHLEVAFGFSWRGGQIFPKKERFHTFCNIQCVLYAF